MNRLKKTLKIYNTDHNSPLHQVLSEHKFKLYESSEYFPDPKLKSGDFVNGVRFEDLQNLSFANNTFDIVISSEVFEHMPFPYLGHENIFRVLKPGGAHVFSVPFVQSNKMDTIMATMLSNGTIRYGPGQPPHFVAPMYHGDPIRPKGVLVFILFGMEMLGKLCDIGFDVEVQRLTNPKYGLLGAGSIVFTAWKPY